MGVPSRRAYSLWEKCQAISGTPMKTIEEKERRKVLEKAPFLLSKISSS